VKRPSREVFVAVGAVIAFACGSSEDGPRGAPADGGTSDATIEGKPADGSATDGAKQCSPFGKPQCGADQTCCFSGFTGTCTTLSACITTTQFQCSQSKNCSAGELCCGTFEDRSDGPTATTFCRSSCTAPAHAICLTSADCPSGEVCTVLPEGSNSPVLAAAVEAFSTCLPSSDGGGP